MKVQQKDCKEGLIKLVFAKSQMGQDNQEWTKWNLWKKAFKQFEGIWSA